MRKRKKTRPEVFDQFQDEERAPEPDPASILAAVERLHTQFNADRSLNQHRFGELERSMQTLDTDILDSHRQWSQRQVELFEVYLDEMSYRLEDVDEMLGERAGSGQPPASELTSIHDRLDGAIGEAMTVRIELDRLAEQVQQRFDEFGVRLAALESRIADHGGDGARPSQNERLDEIERALEQLATRPIEVGSGMARRAVDPGDAQLADRNETSPDPLARLALTLADADRNRGSVHGPSDEGESQPATRSDDPPSAPSVPAASGGGDDSHRNQMAPTMSNRVGHSAGEVGA